MSHAQPPEGFKSFPHAGQICQMIDQWIIPEDEKGILLEFMDRLLEADPGECPGCLQEAAHKEGYGNGWDDGYVSGYREGFRDGGRSAIRLEMEELFEWERELGFGEFDDEDGL